MAGKEILGDYFMRHKRDFYTPLLPFDEISKETRELEIEINLPTSKESLLNVITKRLISYLTKENKLPTNFPLLKLLPSLNKTTHQESKVKFSEDQAADLLKELGVIIQASPSYLGRSRYRVTIPQNLINKLSNKTSS